MGMLKDREQALIGILASTQVTVDPEEATYYRGCLASTRDLLQIDFEEF